MLLREAGREDEARRVMDANRADIAAAQRDGFRSPVFEMMTAEVALWDGQRDEALRLLPKGLLVEPFLATIEDDPIFGALPDSRASNSDMGAIPFGASAADWSTFPFNPSAFAGSLQLSAGLGGEPRRARLSDALRFQPQVESSSCGAEFGLGVIKKQPITP